MEMATFILTKMARELLITVSDVADELRKRKGNL